MWSLYNINRKYDKPIPSSKHLNLETRLQPQYLPMIRKKNTKCEFAARWSLVHYYHNHSCLLRMCICWFSQIWEVIIPTTFTLLKRLSGCRLFVHDDPVYFSWFMGCIISTWIWLVENGNGLVGRFACNVTENIDGVRLSIHWALHWLTHLIHYPW